MKRKILAAGVAIVTITSVLFSPNKSTARTKEAKLIEQTYCCIGGALSGNSNNCKEGTGNCVDHFCLSTETETVGQCGAN